MFAGKNAKSNHEHEPGAVVSSGPRAPWVPKTLLGAIIVVFVIIAGAFGYHHIQQQRTKRNADAAKLTAAQLDEQTFKRLKSEEKVDSASNRYAVAADAWSAYAGKTTSEDHQGQALQHAGLLYFTAGAYQKSLVSFQKAASVTGLTYTEATEIATAAARGGNKEVAIQYLQRALKLMPSSTPDPEAQKQLFNSEIDQLKQDNA